MRDRMPKKDFAGPHGNDYPIPDENHGRLALSGASHAENVGNISPSEEEGIKRKVHDKYPSIGQRVMRGSKMRKGKM
jgi:hypothetical protein